MRTWENIQNEVLGLMFSNTNGGNKISIDDQSVKEYLINMADAFNSGIRELILYKPIIKRYDLKAETPGELITVDMSKVVDNFKGFLENGVYFLCDGDLRRNSTQFYLGTSEIVLKPKRQGTFYIYYKAIPETLTEESSRETVIDIENDMLDAVVYFMASRLYAEDDIQLSTQYLNIFESKKELLGSEYANRRASGGERFVSERGWI